MHSDNIQHRGVLKIVPPTALSYESLTAIKRHNNLEIRDGSRENRDWAGSSMDIDLFFETIVHFYSCIGKCGQSRSFRQEPSISRLHHFAHQGVRFHHSIKVPRPIVIFLVDSLITC
jgi:hypothetical protein